MLGSNIPINLEVFLFTIIILLIVNILVICKACVFLYELNLKIKKRKEKDAEYSKKSNTIFFELRRETTVFKGGRSILEGIKNENKLN